MPEEIRKDLLEEAMFDGICTVEKEKRAFEMERREHGKVKGV